MRTVFKARFWVFVTLLATTPLRMNGLEHDPLLDTSDLAREERDHLRGPALSSVLDDPNPWESYNQWMCFDSTQVQVETAEIDMDGGWVPWPQLRVEALGQTFLISPEVDLPVDAAKELEEWRRELRGSREVCLYAAFLEYSDSSPDSVADRESLWILQRLKTENGYWDVPQYGDDDDDRVDSPDTDLSSPNDK